MNKYTVVGFHTDNEQPAVLWIYAADAKSTAPHVPECIAVVEVFEGWIRGESYSDAIFYGENKQEWDDYLEQQEKRIEDSE